MSEAQETFLSHLIELRERLVRCAAAPSRVVLHPGALLQRRALRRARARRSSRALPRGLAHDRHRRDHAVPDPDEDRAHGGVPRWRCPTSSTRRGRSWRPGLYAHEKKLVLPLVVSSTLLFLVGMLFCYFIVFGKVFAFIASFAPKSISVAPGHRGLLQLRARHVPRLRPRLRGAGGGGGAGAHGPRARSSSCASGAATWSWRSSWWPRW